MSSSCLLRFGEGAKLFGVDVSQLLQLPLASAVEVLDVHHVRLLDASVHPELVTDAWDEAWLVLAGTEELSVQGQNLLLQLTVPRHRTLRLHHHHHPGANQEADAADAVRDRKPQGVYWE